MNTIITTTTRAAKRMLLPFLLAISALLAPSALAATPPTLNPPIGLPFALDDQATLTAGPHENNNHQCLSGDPVPCNSLDFAPASGRVAAAGPGVVMSVPASCSPGLVVIQHQTGGVANGWYTGYYHLTNIQVQPGNRVSEGQRIGDLAQTWAAGTPCGGSWGAPHVHFFVKYSTNGIGDPFQNTGPDVDLQNIVLGGWKVTKTTSAQGCMTYMTTGEQRCSPSGVVKNYSGSSGGLSSKNRLSSASFEGSSATDRLSGWNLNSNQINWTTYSKASYPGGALSAKDGSSWMEANVGSAPCTSSKAIYQDVPVALSSGDSYTLSAWVRTPSSAYTYNGTLQLYGLNGSTMSPVSGVAFTATSTWKLVSVPLDVHQSGPTKLRAVIYLGDCDPSHNLDVDGVSLFGRGNTR